MPGWRALLIEAEVLILDASVPKSRQHRRNSPIGVLKLPIQPLVGPLMAFLLDHVPLQLLNEHLLLLAVQRRVLLQGLLELRLLMKQLLPLRRDVREVLNDGVLAIEQHDQHRHCLDVLLGKVCVLKLHKVVLVVYL